MAAIARPLLTSLLDVAHTPNLGFDLVACRIFYIGRFFTLRPQLWLDSTYQEVRCVEWRLDLISHPRKGIIVQGSLLCATQISIANNCSSYQHFISSCIAVISNCSWSHVFLSDMRTNWRKDFSRADKVVVRALHTSTHIFSSVGCW